jgi:hypothetical protein
MRRLFRPLALTVLIAVCLLPFGAGRLVGAVAG